MTTERQGTPRLDKEPDAGSSAALLLRSQERVPECTQLCGWLPGGPPSLLCASSARHSQPWLHQDALLQADFLHTRSLWQLSWLSITKYQTLGASDNRRALSHSSEGQRLKSNDSRLLPSWGCEKAMLQAPRLSLGLEITHFLLDLYMAPIFTSLCTQFSSSL